MPITYDVMKQVTAQLYEWSLRKVPDDTLDALLQAGLDFAFELFGGAAGDEAFLGREHQLPRLSPLMEQIGHPTWG